MSTAPDVTGALVAAAQDYRTRGLLVIQLHHIIADDNEIACSCRAGKTCTSKGKHPVNSKWQESDRPSGPDIQAMWEKRPAANVGIATGAASAVWVLDIDPDHSGAETMRALTDEHGKLPKTLVVQTGSGGFHYYFKMAMGLRNSQNRVGRGIDVRAEGGQVVAPPSRSDKGPYTILSDAPIAEAPEWLLELARKPEPTDVEIVTADDLPRPEDIDPAEWDRLTTYAKRAIDSELARLDALGKQGWDGEPWNHTTFEVSCSLIEFANSPWNAYSLGRAAQDVYTRAPRDDQFDDYTVKKTFNSAREKVGDKARAVPASLAPRRDEPDPLFTGPDVRGRRQDPTQGGGDTNPGSVARFFTGDRGTELDATKLADEIIALGPVGWGRDEDFWSYDDGVWRSDRKVVKRRCTELLGYKYRPGHSQTARDVVQFRATFLPGDPVGSHMNFRNGMLDWQTGDILDHDPGYLSTIQFPLDYRPEAECPTFDAFLADILHPDYIRLAWEMLGYLMYSGNKLQVAFLLSGTGQNGKGTLIRIIESILGRENIAHESLDQLNKSNFSTVNLFGKIANIAGDIDATYQESTANFKKITGEDTIGAERKFGDRFEFESWAVPLFSANKIPGSADVTEGYLRRWVILQFNKLITKPVRGLSDLLASEVEGIAAKAVLALQDLMKTGEFTVEGEAKKGREEMAETIDQVRQWVKHGGPNAAPDHLQPLSELYFEYTVWANRVGNRPVGQQEFSHRLEAIGFHRVDTAGHAYHKGLRIAANQPSTPHNFF